MDEKQQGQHIVLTLQLQTTIETLRNVPKDAHSKVGVMNALMQAMTRVELFTAEERELLRQIAEAL